MKAVLGSVVVVAAHYLLEYTPLGRHFYAIGSNRNASNGQPAAARLACAMSDASMGEPSTIG